MDKLSHLIPKALRKAGAARAVHASIVAQTLLAVIGELLPQAKGKCAVCSYKNGVVRIRCDESYLTDDIRLAQTELIRIANEHLGDNTITRILPTS